MKLSLAIICLILITGCDGFLNRFIDESQDKFNPELTSLYNQILKQPNSEARILGISHYSLTCQTLEFLDTLKIDLNNLPCDSSELNCIYLYLNESIKGNMLKEYLANTRSNFTAMSRDSSTILYIENAIGSFDTTNNWLKLNFRNKNKKDAVNTIDKFKEAINQCSLLIMKGLLSEAT